MQISGRLASASLLFSKNFSPSSAFSNYFFHNRERQSAFFVFQSSHISKGKDAHPALLARILLAPQAREGQLRPADVSHVYKK